MIWAMSDLFPELTKPADDKPPSVIIQPRLRGPNSWMRN
jgi:hypothetical protein